METKLMDRFEEHFEAWLKAFEERPIKTGLVIVIAVLLIRWVWRSFR